MKTLKFILPILATAAAAFVLASCDDHKTYAELLQDENHYVNAFLADQRVIASVPEDKKFETGPEAPYYRIDDDGNLYMQVVDPGTPGDTVAYNDLVYVRFSRYSLASYADGELPSSEGNDPVLGGNYSFRFGNYETASSYNMGSGIQVPLSYLPIDATVNIIIKSQYGMPSEMSYVQPYLYSVRYFRPKI